MVETRGEDDSDRFRETLPTLLADWREALSRCVEEAEKFTREKPAAGLAAAFVAGLLACSFFRRR